MSRYISEDITLLLSNIEDEDYNVLCINIIEFDILEICDYDKYNIKCETNNGYFYISKKDIPKLLITLPASDNLNKLIEFKLKDL